MLDMSSQIHCQNLVIGGGLAGIVTALELLNNNQPITLLEKRKATYFGGQANDAFGGMLLVDTPVQRKAGIDDSPSLALQDWYSAAEFKDSDVWGKRWAEFYVNQCKSQVYDWLVDYGIRFLPAVHWVERGDFRPGNSVPRYHIAWGCGRGIASTLIKALLEHKNRHRLTLLFEHQVTDFIQETNKVTGIHCLVNQQEKKILADNIVIASGGINGNLTMVKQVWDPCYGPYPENTLSGCDPSADGYLHQKSKEIDARVINLNQMWNYAAGVAHPRPKYPKHGLSLIPARSSLWMDCYGNRIGPKPMMTGFDTHDLCKQTGNLPQQYTWQIMNFKIARKELAASGTDENPNFRDKNVLGLAKDLLFGNKKLVNDLIDNCDDVVAANSLPELVSKMNEIAPQSVVSLENMQRDIDAYDEQIKRGYGLYNDDQLRKIEHVRHWQGDKLRTCKFQTILDPKHFPLIAIRSRIISRKSMGGFETNLNSQVMSSTGSTIDNLYAVGEAAGFGGGGISGIRSLEGTFLSNCILNGRTAARSIVSKTA